MKTCFSQPSHCANITGLCVVRHCFRAAKALRWLGNSVF
jgi:hypothetical protein